VRERPLDFSTEDKPGRRLLVFTRVKPGEGDANDGLTGYVGVAIQARQGPQQIVIMEVVDGGPAQKAGLKKDDVLLTVGGTEATELRAVVEAIRQAKPGSELTFRVKRGDREKDINVKVGFLPFILLD
jgi:S1-C subfamily serine protease